jgi:hypothetical protein
VVSENSLEILIQDDGCGFNTGDERRGNGLINLHGASRNRVGEFEVFSRFRSKLSERGGELRAIARASLRSKVRDVSALFSPDAFV